MNLNFLESFADWSDDRSEDLYQVRFVLTWRTFYGLSLAPELGVWQRKITDSFEGSQKEQYVTAGITARWLFRKLSLDLSLFHNQQSVNDTNTRDSNAIFRLRRQFR